MDLDVLSAGAGKSLVESLQARFTAQTGVSIHATFLAVGAIMEKLLAGEPCDVVILTATQLESLSRSGRIVADSVVALGRVETALAVKTGEPIPDISDRDRLRRSLCAADAIYLPDAERSTAGIHLVSMLRALGIHADVEPRLHSYPGGAIAMRELAQSEAEHPIGCAQVTEIRGTRGVAMLGALPQEFALATVYSVAVNAKAHQPELAYRFAALLTGPDARELRTSAGFEVL
jgi:molybdate transport system substrate-binding protein